jgi:hypothetical protein
MQAEHSGSGWKLLIIMLVGLTGLFLVLVVLGSSHAKGSDSRPGQIMPVQEKSENSPEKTLPSALVGFAIIPGTAVLVDDHHVVAMLEKADKEFYAVALFQVDCDQSGCTPNDVIAFSIVDRNGDDVQPAGQIVRPQVGALAI